MANCPVVQEVDGTNPLNAELISERASAYFDRIRKMQAALGALSRSEKLRVHQESPRDEYERRHNELFAEAAEQVWFFIIQRECLRLPVYEELFTEFEIPEEVRKQMGPKQLLLDKRRANR